MIWGRKGCYLVHVVVGRGVDRFREGTDDLKWSWGILYIGRGKIERVSDHLHHNQGCKEGRYLCQEKRVRTHDGDGISSYVVGRDFTFPFRFFSTAERMDGRWAGSSRLPWLGFSSHSLTCRSVVVACWSLPLPRCVRSSFHFRSSCSHWSANLVHVAYISPGRRWRLSRSIALFSSLFYFILFLSFFLSFLTLSFLLESWWYLSMDKLIPKLMAHTQCDVTLVGVICLQSPSLTSSEKKREKSKSIKTGHCFRLYWWILTPP